MCFNLFRLESLKRGGNKMRYSKEIFCIRCGKFLFELTDEEMEKVRKDREMGTRTNCEYFCKNRCNRNKK